MKLNLSILFLYRGSRKEAKLDECITTLDKFVVGFCELDANLLRHNFVKTMLKPTFS